MIENIPSSSPLSNIDPIMLATTALVVGFAVGSGRAGWLGQTVLRLAESLTTLTITSVSDEIRNRNPEFFRLQPARPSTSTH